MSHSCVYDTSSRIAIVLVTLDMVNNKFIISYLLLTIYYVLNAPEIAAIAAMSNVVGCQCRPSMSIPSAAAAVSGRISRLLDNTHVYASDRNLTSTHLARGLAIRCEQHLLGKLGRHGRSKRRTKLKNIKLSSKGFSSAEIRMPLIPSSTSSYVNLGRPVAASNFNEAAESATQAAEQLSQSLKDLGRYVSSYNNSEDIQRNLNSVNQSVVVLAGKAAEISTSVASNIRSQMSATASLKNLESLQEAFGNLSQSLTSIAQKSVDLSTAALSSAPTDLKDVQGQIDQIAKTLNSNWRLEALQESVDSARQLLTAALEEAALGSSSSMLRSSISNGNGKISSLEHVGASLSNVLHNAQILASEIGTRIVHLPTNGIHFDTSSLSAPLEHALTQIGTSVSSISSASPWLTGGTDSSALATSALLATLATSGAVVSSFKLAENGSKSFVEGQDLPLRYDAGTIGAYFRKRPLDVFLRSVRILFSCSTLVFNILFDKYVGRDQELERLRATQMVELIAGLGPTAIKVRFGTFWAVKFNIEDMSDIGSFFLRV